MGRASVGIVTRNPRGFFLGMICHLVVEIPAVPAVLGFGPIKN
jgi:hypothetical protein